MPTLRISSARLRAAMRFCAKDDPRYYLGGVHISRDYIYATDGFMAIRMKHDAKVRSDVIVKLSHKVPPKSTLTKLHLLGEDSYAEHFNYHGQVIAMSSIEIIHGKHPDINGLLQKARERPEGNKMPSLRASLLQRACKAICLNGVTENTLTCKIPENKEDAVLFFSTSSICNNALGSPEIIIMPVRESASTE